MIAALFLIDFNLQPSRRPQLHFASSYSAAFVQKPTGWIYGETEKEREGCTACSTVVNALLLWAFLYLGIEKGSR